MVQYAACLAFAALAAKAVHHYQSEKLALDAAMVAFFSLMTMATAIVKF